MPSIKKKDIKNYKLSDSKSKKDEIDELVDGDGSPIEGDKADVNDTEIETSPQQTSDEFAQSAIQPNRYYFGYAGSPYSHGSRVASESEELGDNEISEMARDKMKKMVEDLVSSKSNGRDFVKKYRDSDVNRNEIPDLNDLSQTYQKPIPARKAEDLLDTIRKNNLNGEEVGIILNFLMANIDTTQIPDDYKRILKSKV